MRLLLFRCNHGHICFIDLSIIPIQSTSSFPLPSPSETDIMNLYEKMMAIDQIIEAKQRAEAFLFKAIEEKWNEIVKDTNSIEYRDVGTAWPLRFEAYAYLAHLHKELIPRFSTELKGLWSEWINMRAADEPKKRRIFWELEDIFPLPTIPKKRIFLKGIFLRKKAKELVDKMAQTPEVDIDSLVAMFRATEILGIRGFEKHFANASKTLVRWLMVNDVFAGISHRIIWQINRSSFLRESLNDPINQTIAPQVKQKISDYESEYKKHVEELKQSGICDTLVHLFEADINFWAEAGFFRSLNNPGIEPDDTIKKIAVNLLERQNENGSFDDDLLTTCLAASCIHLTNIGLSRNAATKKAIEWLSQHQDSNGSWSSEPLESSPDLNIPRIQNRNYWIPLMRTAVPYIFEKTIEDQIQTTVIVLETIDLLCGIEPQPIWSAKAAPPAKKPGEDLKQGFSPLIPPGTEWNQVIIECINEEYVFMTAGDKKLGAQNYTVLGFRDEKTKKGNKLWELLLDLGKYDGTISYENIAHRVSIKDVSRLRKELKRLFPIDGDPIPYSEADKAYVAKFKITYKEASEDPGVPKTEVEELLEEEQAGMIRKFRQGIEADMEREITGKNNDKFNKP
jgi:hypothetical protein